MADKTLTCRECGNTFTFTEGEQDFYAQKGFGEPSRCPDCRAAKKAARNSGGYDSYGSDRSYGGGGGGYSSDRSYGGGGGGYGRSERTMTQVVCANCGKDTEVPFSYLKTTSRSLLLRLLCSDEMGGGASAATAQPL